MLVPMAQLEVVGQLRLLDHHLATLQQLRAAEVVRVQDQAAPPDPAAPTTMTSADDGPADRELPALLARVDALLALIPDLPEAAPAGPVADGTAPAGPGVGALADPDAVRALVTRGERAAAGPRAALEHLRGELDGLPRTERSLAALLPLVPELVDLTDADLAQLRLATIVLVLDDPEGAVRAEIASQLTERFGARHLFVSAPVDESLGCLLVLPTSDVAEVEQLLGRDRVAAVELPRRYAGRSLRATVQEMEARLAELPGLVAAAERDLTAALAPDAAALHTARADLAALIERRDAARAADTGERTYALRLWVPRHRRAAVTEALAEADRTVVVTEVPGRRWVGTPPLLLRNPRAARPYERLVSFLAWPQTGTLDPTGLMAVVLPVLFGIMVGDIGYGLLLMGIGWWARRRFGRRSAVGDDAGRILLVGGFWATVFGVLYGELFGNLGSSLGMPALWFYRGGPDALTPLLLFVLGVGAAHIVLGLLLGIWLAVRERHLGHVLERGGSLLVLMGLFGIAGAVTSLLPGGVLPVSAAVVAIGLVAASVPHGPLGALLGPLEAVSRIGNVLSYLRLAAVGLASVYLAIVANELGRQAPLLVGIVIAVFFHALNLALAAFSPMIQALRLHYVEFFGTFFEGGGRPFHPLGAGIPVRPAPTPAPAAPPAALARPPTPVPAR